MNRYSLQIDEEDYVGDVVSEDMKGIYIVLHSSRQRTVEVGSFIAIEARDSYVIAVVEERVVKPTFPQTRVRPIPPNERGIPFTPSYIERTVRVRPLYELKDGDLQPSFKHEVTVHSKAFKLKDGDVKALIMGDDSPNLNFLIYLDLSKTELCRNLASYLCRLLTEVGVDKKEVVKAFIHAARLNSLNLDTILSILDEVGRRC